MGDRDYILELKTDMDMGERSFIRNFVQNLFKYDDKNMRVEYYSIGEPVNKPLDETSVDRAVDLWLSEGIGLMFKRKTKPRYLMSIDWRSQKGNDPRQFPWSCTVWINKAANQNTVVSFFCNLILQIEPVFGHITSESDSRKKHFFQKKTERGLEESYVGCDVGDTLPGIYWVTYFGPQAIKMLGGLHRFTGMTRAKIYDRGIMLKIYEKFTDIGSKYALNEEEKMRRKLGEKLFFNIRCLKEQSC